MNGIPPDLVAVGHVSDAFGLRGEVSITPYSTEAGALLKAKEVWLDRGGVADSREVLSAKLHGGKVNAQLVGIADRTAAERLKGARVSVPRCRFPVLDTDEFYWVDLIGLEVVTQSGESLGRVGGLIDNGAHQILEVRGGTGEGAVGKGKEHLIPFVDAFVKTVDRDAKRITVDWDSDY